MTKNFIQNPWLRSAGLTAYQIRARIAGIGAKGPRVFINSLPKSGTHLLTSQLAKLPQFRNSYVHLKTVSVGSDNSDGIYKINKKAFERQISRVAKGQYFSGHLPYDPEIVSILNAHEIQTINLVRDPRDMLVSRAHYVANLRRHKLHKFLIEHTTDLNSQIQMLITGPQQEQETMPQFPAYTTVLDRFAGWVENENILTLKFEDLVGMRGGGDDDLKKSQLLSAIDFLGIQLTDEQIATIFEPQDITVTPTLRKGIIGDWKNSFDDASVELCELHLGKHLHSMGYV